MIGVGIDLFRYGGGAESTSLFNVVTYSGNSSSQDITGVGFDPDLIWIKRRTGTGSNSLTDVVRGDGKGIFTDSTIAEINNASVYPSLISDGFNIPGASATLNQTGDSYAAWCFKAGGTAVSNTDGSITSQVSANVDAGFNVVSWTATNSTSNVGHGMSVAPELIITKSRDSVSSWMVYTTAVDGSLDYLYLNSTLGKSNAAGSAPTSSVFYVNNTEGAGTNNSNYRYIAYCFHSVEGFSKIGTYLGTGADQAISGLGFQPDFVLIKRTDSTGNWCIADSARLTSGESNFLYPNLNNAESVSAVITMESDGFSMDGSGGDYNASGGTYIYMAIKGPA